MAGRASEEPDMPVFLNPRQLTDAQRGMGGALKVAEKNRSEVAALRVKAGTGVVAYIGRFEVAVKGDLAPAAQRYMQTGKGR